MRQTAQSNHSSLLIDIDKELIDKPYLWAIYDGYHHLRRKPDDRGSVKAESVKAEEDKAAREALIYLHFNLYELVFNFYYALKSARRWWVPGSGPNKADELDESVWRKYARGLMHNRSEARDVFARPYFSQMYGERFVEYLRGISE